MSIKVRIDRLDDLACEERAGVIRKLVRKARCICEGNDRDDSYKILSRVLNLLTLIPQTGDALAGAEFQMLRLANRSAKLAFDDEPSVVDVTLTYLHVLDCDTQFFGFDEVVFGRMRTSIQQIQTNLQIGIDVETGEEDLVPIVVKHTFPDGTDTYFYKDPETGDTITLKRDSDLPGIEVVQGGEVTISVPMRNYQVTGLMYTADPYFIEDKMKGKTNSVPIFPRTVKFDTDGNILGLGTWLCQEVHWEVVIIGEIPEDTIYKFSFEFQENPDGWDPDAVFIDDRTKRPPPGIKPGVGAITAKEYERVDFETILGCKFEDTSVADDTEE